MKINSYSHFTGVLLIVVMTLISCEKKSIDDTIKGTAEFSVALPEDLTQAKSATTADTALLSYQIMISVEDLSGAIVFSDKMIPVYKFGSGYVSENIEIRTGEFKLTKFMVINPSGTVVFAAPKAGSPLAYLTKRPLPFNFNIFPNAVTKILPEVLAVGDQTPDKFGYASFGVQIINPVHLWTMCVLDPGNPMIMAPIQITTAKLTVQTPDGWYYSFKLEATQNHLVIRGGTDIYYFILEKEGYMPQKMQFTAKELMATTKESPLILKIPWNSQNKMIVIQPGPEKGKDAMVSNLEPEKNFGSHKYFEATFLTEPVLTVMRSNRSMIFFNLDTLPKSIIKKVSLQLFYDVPIPFSNTYTTDVYPSTGLEWYGGVLQQIVEPWDENKVTWNTQPKTIETNQVLIPPFIRNVNFIEVDVTRLFISPVANPLPNHGMLFKLWPTDKFPGFRFASSDHAESKMRPRLTIQYTIQ